MKKLLFFTILIFLASTNIFAQDSADNPIDQKLETCLGNARGTIDNRTCHLQAYEDWDAALNKHYKTLRNVLDEESSKELQLAQRIWIKYRDAEFKLLAALYKGKEGTMYPAMQISDKTSVVRDRALILEDYINLLEY